MERPKPQPWQPENEGQGYPRIPSIEQLLLQVAIDASKTPKLINLFMVGGEHRIELEFKRTAGEGGLALSFPVGSESGVLVLDCFPKEGPFSGIDWVQGVPVTDQRNPTSSKGTLIETDKLHRLKIEVRRGHILAELDGKKIVDANLGPDDVGGSHLLYPPSPAHVRLKAFDGKFVLSKYQSRIITVEARLPEELPAEGVKQIPGPGEPRDASKFALVFGETLTLRPEKHPLLNFQQPFTVECWFRQAREDNDWFLLLNSSMKLEFHREDVFTKRPEVMLGHDGGGINGKLPSWDTEWHHVAMCNDEYYTQVYVDGEFLFRAVTAYIGRDTGAKPFQIGYRPGPGSKIHGFEGNVRDFRISNVDRYPRSQSFDPPAILGYDEHVTCQLDLRDGTLALRPTAGNLGKVTVTADMVDVVQVE